MENPQIESDVTRLAELVGENVPKEAQEAVGIAVGLFGLAVIALVRIADALEAR